MPQKAVDARCDISKMIDGGAFDFDDEVSNAVTSDDASCTSSNVEDDVLLTNKG